MPTEFWYPISGAVHDLTYDQFANSGGANKNASTRAGGGRGGPATHDDATSYVIGNSNETRINQDLNIDWPGPMAVEGTATAFSIYFRHRYGGGAQPKSRELYLINAGGTRGGAIAAVTDSNVSWVNTGQAGPIAAGAYRPGGGSWAVSDFADDQTLYASLSVFNAATGFSAGHITSIWGDIAYTPTGGGFAFLLNLAGASALPFVGRMVDSVSFRKYLEWRRVFHPRHTKWTAKNEAKVAWDEYRGYKWPTFFQIGAVT